MSLFNSSPDSCSEKLFEYNFALEKGKSFIPASFADLTCRAKAIDFACQNKVPWISSGEIFSLVARRYKTHKFLRSRLPNASAREKTLNRSFDFATAAFCAAVSSNSWTFSACFSNFFKESLSSLPSRTINIFGDAAMTSICSSKTVRSPRYPADDRVQ